MNNKSQTSSNYNQNVNLKKDWITTGINNEAINWAEKTGKDLATKNQNKPALSSSQLRKFFGALKALQNEILLDNNIKDEDSIDKFKSNLLMLKPQLAYAAARAKNNNSKIHDFHKIVSECIDHVTTKKHFKNFISLLEAIVAYHKVEEESNESKKKH